MWTDEELIKKYAEFVKDKASVQKVTWMNFCTENKASCPSVGRKEKRIELEQTALWEELGIEVLGA